ncbi:interferon-induced protein with tetratricopeptide repeats 2-like [Alosa alosa]|uniref:interferon-induced protein with tetratricopeptide repeats 2-like n=1 Tax=Alosa alosa TaxID=278164 RepID=UPI00201534F6|nr:interferon-induced protein with tetratricopeptide repeats 2-like [Alosa alosa]
MTDFDLQDNLKNMECHFNWQLDSSPSTLENLHQDLKDRLQTGCTWKCQLHNLLGYVLHAQGSRDEALTHLKKAEKMIKEQRDEEKDCLLLVNQANLAWVHYSRGELKESRAYLEEVTRLQEALPASPGSQIHPELSGQKGWSLLKFERSKKQQAIECFKMSLEGNPQKALFHKGLALAMEKGYTESEVTPELKKEIVEKLRVAKQMDENDICVAALFMIQSFPNSGDKEGAREEANKLAGELIASGCLDGLDNILYLLMYHCQEIDKALDVAETMLNLFPHSTRAKKALANSLKRKVFSLEESDKRKALATRAIALYKDVNTQHSVKGRCSLAVMHVKVDDIDAANNIYRNLLGQNHLSDAEKQLLYLQYGDYLYWERKRTSEAIDMYIKAAKVPAVSDDKNKCIQRLVSIVRDGGDDRCNEICAFLLDLHQFCVGCRHIGLLFLKK